MTTVKQLCEFWNILKDELFPLIQNSVAIWNGWIYEWVDDDDPDNLDITRALPPFKLIHVKNDKEDLIVLDFFREDVSDDTFAGCAIARWGENLLLIREAYEFEYECNECWKEPTSVCYHCEQCDYDLCSSCIESSTHEHALFKNNLYFGLDTYEKKDIESFILVRKCD